MKTIQKNVNVIEFDDKDNKTLDNLDIILNTIKDNIYQGCIISIDIKETIDDIITKCTKIKQIL